MKKFVISGGPASGKSSLCSELKERGVCVVGEVATKILEKGIPKDWKKFNHEVFKEQIELEKKCCDRCAYEVIFLDRSLIDSIVYMKYYNIDLPENYKEEIKKANYEKVFFLEMLPEGFYHNKLPIEESRKISDLTKQTYKEFKVPMVEVPVLESVKARADLVLKNLRI